MSRLSGSRRAHGVDGVVRRLTAATFVLWVGAGALLPMLPRYVQVHGGSDAVVGGVMAAFFGAGVLTQYPLGRLTDRVGHRSVLIGGLVAYAAATAAFLLPVEPTAEIALRAAQGVGTGALQVASMAMVGAAVAPARRGRAFAQLYAGQLAGLAIGPLVGGAVGLAAMPALFAASAVVAVVAAVPLLSLPAPALAPVRTGEPPVRLLGRRMAGVLLAGMAWSVPTGVYEACWTLLLDARGASPLQVGLSWTLFCLPFAAMTPLSGRLADARSRERYLLAALVSTAAFAALYPYVGSVGWLIGLGAAEAVGVAVAYPAAQAVLADSVPTSVLGSAQGLFTTAQTAAIAVGAGAGGALFHVATWAPFVAASVTAVALTAAIPVVWHSSASGAASAAAGATAGDCAPGPVGDAAAWARSQLSTRSWLRAQRRP